MLDVRRLTLLCDLDRLGTIAAVAQARSYTPSAVSQQLSALEREAGTELLERSGRRVTLTAAGHTLVAHAEAVLAALERATAALAQLSAGLTGPLSIGAFPTAARTLLPAALIRLGRDHPGLDLRVTELDPVAVPRALRERRLDVGLVQDYDLAPAAPEPGLDSTALLDETVHLATPATSPRTTVEQCHDAAWILPSPGTLCHTVTVQVCRAAGFVPRARHYADDFATVLALVAADQGVSLVPQLAAGPVAAGASPVVVDRTSPRGASPAGGVRLSTLPARRRTRIAYRRGAGAHPAIAAFVAALRDSAADHLPAATGTVDR
ncbi:LysR substrate-binding domain-containing protein [Actinoplanes sp. NPDC049316]|uniref:LysR substrate-binding domain-containing protein n=1 Tax=Actinoplanes sp. NPDC049316 TaxID=3154727 RepID=UPI0034412162